MPAVRVAVLGHVEWVDFVGVQRVPIAGEIVRTTPIASVAAGGGAVAAVAFARWGAESVFFTAFGGDALGRQAHDELVARGVQVRATFHAVPQRRALTLVDAQRERTIVLVGERHVARASDALPWDELATCDAVYITGGDVEAVRLARRARVVVSTARVLPLVREAGIELDALVGSDSDPDEKYAPGDLPIAPRIVVRTAGARGGTWMASDGAHTYAAVPAVVTGDTYGAGDTFAAGLTYALGEGQSPEAAVAFAAARAAEVVTFVGPYPSGT
jgi:ribokinase